MAEDKKEIIPIICGPTGSGKTEVAIKLAEILPFEIISADSRQVIKYLNIGTAKPTKEEKQKAKFYLIDMVEPGERYSAFKFTEDANDAIVIIKNNNKLPLIVGGTGLYLKALTEGVIEIEQDDFSIRKKLEKQLKENGADKLYELLQKIDPTEASKIHPNNKVRLIRALEIYYLTGKSKSEIMESSTYRRSQFDFMYYCLIPDRKKIYERINQRVDKMIQNGLLEEIQTLLQNGYKDSIRKANVIGYNELLNYVEGNLSLSEAVNMIKQNSRRYAKRQITWFKNQTRCSLFKNTSELFGKIKEDYKNYST